MSADRQRVYEDTIPSLDLRPFIGGEFAHPLSKEIIPVFDPMTEELLVEIPAACAADVDIAVSEARQAFDKGKWTDMHPRTRILLLDRLADLIERNCDDIARLETADTGKLYRGVREWDIPHAALVYRYYAGWADKLTGTILPGLPRMEMLVRREPIGVCAAIIPWNFPFACLAWKIAPALAVGCTVVVKTSPCAPLSAQYLAHLVREAGFPRGVINILCGDEETGRALVSNHRVDLVTFTGRAATAQDILLSSRSHLPQVIFELGDKTAQVICEDADLDSATSEAVHAAFHLSGQNCCAGSRILVQKNIFGRVLKRMTALTKARRLGDPFFDETEQGPHIDRAHVESIDRLVKEAKASGGICVIGGSPWGDGQFYAPTLFTGLPHDAPLNREEVFGPVATLTPFADIDEAIDIINDRNGGLAAAIWTKNESTSYHFARKAQVGTCWVNCYGNIDLTAPWGGRKLSGTGRELGLEGIEQFCATKTVMRRVY